MTVAYLIVAHHKPEQLLRLVRTIRAGSRGPIIVHVDAKSRRQFRQALQIMRQMDDVIAISSVRVSWGHFSIVRAVLAALRTVLARYPEVEHIKHLSGQDYPLRPVAEFEEWLSTRRGQSVMERHRLPQPGREDQFAHAEYLYLTRHRYVSLRWPVKRRLPDGITFYFGSAFWCLSRRHAAHVLNLPRRAQRFFHGVLGSDEFFFQTLISNSPFADQVQEAELTFMDWPDRAPSPKVFREVDAARLLESQFFWGRKFDAELDGAVLDRLDARLQAARRS